MPTQFATAGARLSPLPTLARWVTCWYNFAPPPVVPLTNLWRADAAAASSKDLNRCDKHMYPVIVELRQNASETGPTWPSHMDVAFSPTAYSIMAWLRSILRLVIHDADQDSHRLKGCQCDAKRGCLTIQQQCLVTILVWERELCVKLAMYKHDW
jgi:hypothetical protein